MRPPVAHGQQKLRSRGGPEGGATIVDEAVPGQPLPVLYLVGEGEAPEWRALAFLVRYRQNGFMVLLPDDPEVLSRLQSATSDEEETLGTVPAFKTIEVETETSRRRLTGNVSALLADFDWSFLELFRRAASGTARVAGGMRLITLKAGEAVVRPLRPSALAVSEVWVNEMISDASLAEYITAEEGAEDDEAADRESGEDPEITEVEALRSRVRELEANVRAAAQQQPPRPGALKSARPLFPDQPEQRLTEDDWQKLRAAAGSAPPRLAAHERAERKSQAALADTALAEEELGAAEAALDIPEGSPALLQLLATQAKLLEKVMAPKAQDPLTAALAGGASGSDSVVGSSSGARGMAARDAFLRIFDRPLDYAESVANRAQTELGWEAQEPSMMRHYLERKVPLKDLKTVQLFSFLLAHMWEDMRRTGNQRGEFWAARGLVMAEQFAVDAGRTQFGWLLSGLPDVDQGHLINRKGDLRPYGRLSAAPWIAAQVPSEGCGVSGRPHAQQADRRCRPDSRPQGRDRGGHSAQTGHPDDQKPLPTSLRREHSQPKTVQMSTRAERSVTRAPGPRGSPAKPVEPSDAFNLPFAAGPLSVSAQALSSSTPRPLDEFCIRCPISPFPSIRGCTVV